MKKNEKGSTLVAAVVIIMIVMVVLGASISIASTYYNNTVNDVFTKQTYLSAKSGIDLLASHVAQDNIKVIPQKNGDKKIMKNISIENDVTKNSGFVLRVNKNTIKIVVISKRDNTTSKLQLIMQFNEEKWEKNAYCEVKEGDAPC